jgi:hypothetical protein
MSPRSVQRSLRILLVCATGNIIASTRNCLMQSAYPAQIAFGLVAEWRRVGLDPETSGSNPERGH